MGDLLKRAIDKTRRLFGWRPPVEIAESEMERQREIERQKLLLARLRTIQRSADVTLRTTGRQ